MNPLSLFFAKYKAVIWLVVAGALFGAGWTAQGWRLNAKADREAAERQQAENAAILTRIKNNERKVEQDKLNSARIAKEHQRELDKVRADIAAERLRVGPEFCSGFAQGADPDSPSGSDGADTGGRVLLEEVDRNLKALMEAIEKTAATGRACQEFVRSNGMAPE